MQRIGILGGSFDPIHNGHLVIAQEVCVRLRLDQVLFVPARVSPLKMGQQPTSAHHRCQMIQLAIQDNPRFRLSRIDLDRPAPSFTVDTLALLQEEWGPHTQLFFIMGEDALLTLTHWRQPERIIRQAHLVIVKRPGYTIDMDELEAKLPGLVDATTFLDTPELSVSSTDLRQRMQRGWPIRYQVPDTVLAYINQHKLYREAPPAAASPPDIHRHHAHH